MNSTCLFLMEVWSDRGSTCKFRNARSAFRNLHVDPLSLHTSMRNKQVEFNPYIYTLTTLSKLYRFDYEISVFNTKHPVVIIRRYTVSCRFIENWMSKFFLCIVAENTGSVNIYWWQQWGEKGRYLIRSYEKSPYTPEKIQKATWQNRHQKVWLHNDCGST